MAGTLQDVTYTKYEKENSKDIYVVAPESDKEELHLPSIALPVKVPCNPRPALICVTDEVMTEDSDVQKYKEYAFENSVVIAFSESIEDAYAYVTEKSAALNVKKGNVSLAADAAHMDKAKEIAEKLGAEVQEVSI